MSETDAGSWTKLKDEADGALSSCAHTTPPDMSDSNLRPLTLPSLSPALTRLSALKAQITSLHSQVDQFSKLADRLESFTDEPSWNAYVSLAPVARRLEPSQGAEI